MLVDVASSVVFQDTSAELIKRLGHSILLVLTEGSAWLLLTETVDSLVVAEELRHVLSTPVCHCPLKLSWVPLWLSWLLVLWGSFLLNRVAIFVKLNLLGLNNWLRFKFFPFLFSELSGFSLRLQADESSDLTDVTLDLEQLVHVSKLELIVFALELSVVAETFKEDELLVGALLGNSSLNEFYDELHIVVYSRVL